MAQIPVHGAVVFKDGSAYLKISPNSEGMTGTSSNVSGFDMGSSSSNSTPPWPLSAQRSDQKIMDAINNGSVTVHSSRFPRSSTDLRIMLNNIQVSLGLTIGLQGEWSLQADQKLMELLAKPKRVKRKAAVINAIADAPPSRLWLRFDPPSTSTGTGARTCGCARGTSWSGTCRRSSTRVRKSRLLWRMRHGVSREAIPHTPMFFETGRIQHVTLLGKSRLPVTKKEYPSAPPTFNNMSCMRRKPCCCLNSTCQLIPTTIHKLSCLHSNHILIMPLNMFRVSRLGYGCK